MARLRVCILDESSDGNKTEWVLKHRCSVVNSAYQQMRNARPWTIADAYNEYRRTAAQDDESEIEDEEASQEGTSSTLQMMRTDIVIMLGSVFFSLDFIRTRK